MYHTFTPKASEVWIVSRFDIAVEVGGREEGRWRRRGVPREEPTHERRPGALYIKQHIEKKTVMGLKI